MIYLYGKSPFKTCSPFFNALELLFSVHGVVGDSLSKRYLQQSLSKLSDSEQTYAHEHITNNNNLSWLQVKTLFAKRFESHDYVHQLKNSYHTLKFQSHETVQAFSHRFIHLCTELYMILILLLLSIISWDYYHLNSSSFFHTLCS